MIYLAILIGVLFAFPANAAEYFVSTTGTNSNSCVQSQDPATPKLTIAAGVACLGSGDTLTVGLARSWFQLDFLALSVGGIVIKGRAAIISEWSGLK